jgi:hypothetical protein
MPFSGKCDECWNVKRISAYPVDRPTEGLVGSLVNLCRPCARYLGYLTKTKRTEKASV